MTAARVKPSAPGEPADTVFLPGYMLSVLGVSEGGRVRLESARPRQALWVELAPIEGSLAVDEGFVRYVKKRLRDAPVVLGDTIVIPVLSQEIWLKVVGLEPEGPAIIGEHTILSVREARAESPLPGSAAHRRLLRLILERDPRASFLRRLAHALRDAEDWSGLGAIPPSTVLVLRGSDHLIDEAVAAILRRYFKLQRLGQSGNPGIGECSGARSLLDRLEAEAESGPRAVLIESLDLVLGPWGCREAGLPVHRLLVKANLAGPKTGHVVVATAGSPKDLPQWILHEFAIVLDARTIGRDLAREALRAVLPPEWGLADDAIEELAKKAAGLNYGELAMIPGLAAARALTRSPGSKSRASVEPGDIEWAVSYLLARQREPTRLHLIQPIAHP